MSILKEQSTKIPAKYENVFYHRFTLKFWLLSGQCYLVLCILKILLVFYLVPCLWLYNYIHLHFLHLGEYIFCFSNEFSSFSHKTVYFDFQSGEEPPLTEGIGSHHKALTLIETAAVQIHESLKVIIDYQTHHRLREATSRDMAEYLNERVQYWSLGQAIIILIVALIEVHVLRNFFAEKKDRI